MSPRKEPSYLTDNFENVDNFDNFENVSIYVLPSQLGCSKVEKYMIVLSLVAILLSPNIFTHTASNRLRLLWMVIDS